MTDDHPPCSFDKPILHRLFDCTRSLRRNIAEREQISCANATCSIRCAALFRQILSQGRFVNRGAVDTNTLPYAQLVRFQLGAIKGLRSVLRSTQEDIDTLVRSAERSFGSFDDLPYDRIMRDIAATRLRARRPHR